MRPGFTLVEVLIALAIFALISVGGVAMLSFTVENQRAVATRLDRLAALERTRAYLAADLSQAAPRVTRDLNGQARPAFSAVKPTQDGVVLTLVRRGWENPEGRARASTQYVEYSWVEGRLERRARPMLDGTDLGPPAILLTGVSGIDFEYARGSAWYPVSGLYSGFPPEALRFTFTLEGYGTIRQSVFIAASS